MKLYYALGIMLSLSIQSIFAQDISGKSTTGVCTECKGEFKNKSLVGMQIISHFVPNPKKADEYIDGKVFDPVSGNTYKGKIKLMSGGKRLILRGYLGTSLIGRNQTWIRVE